MAYTSVRPITGRFIFVVHFSAAFVFAVATSPGVFAQENPQRDSSALSLLSQAVSVAGGAPNLAAIQDFRASGTIKHFWGRSPEQGQVVVKARGMTQFRLDSELSEGRWSWVANNGSGQIVLPGHSSLPIYAHNCINAGSLILPILKAVAALEDQTTSVVDMGLVQFNNVQVRQIRTQQHFEFDRPGLLSGLTRTDLFFDPQTLSLIATRDIRHPDKDAVNNPLTHTIVLTSYESVNGIMVPFSATETISGQKTWQIQLNAIEFNTGLTDSDFHLQTTE